MKNKTLIISLDAFRFDYLNHASFLRQLANDHKHGELKTIYGYTGIGAVINTGQYPKDQGVWLEYVLSDKKSLKFLKNISGLDSKIGRLILNIIFNLVRFMTGKTYLTKLIGPIKQLVNFEPTLNKDWGDKNPLAGHQTLFDKLREKNINFIYYDWPLKFTNQGRFLDLTKNNDETKINKLIKDKDKADLFWLRIWDLDTASHTYGPDSSEVKTAIKKVDQLCQKLLKEFGSDTRFLFWADHGMVSVKNKIDLSDVIEGVNYPYFLDSTLARFWPGDKKQKLLQKLKQVNGGQVLTEDDYTKHHLDINDKRYGEVVFAANPGNIIFPNFYNSTPPKGMHGYDPDRPEQKGLYISSLGQGREDKKMVDMYEEILRLINIYKL